MENKGKKKEKEGKREASRRFWKLLKGKGGKIRGEGQVTQNGFIFQVPTSLVPGRCCYYKREREREREEIIRTYNLV